MQHSVAVKSSESEHDSFYLPGSHGERPLSERHFFQIIVKSWRIYHFELISDLLSEAMVLSACKVEITLEVAETPIKWDFTAKFKHL